MFCYQALLSQKDIAASLAEDLLKQFAQGAELDLEQPTPTPPASLQPTPTPTNTDTISNPPSNIKIVTEPTSVLAIGGPMGRPPVPRGRPGKGILIAINTSFSLTHFHQSNVIRWQRLRQDRGHIGYGR